MNSHTGFTIPLESTDVRCCGPAQLAPQANLRTYVLKPSQTPTTRLQGRIESEEAHSKLQRASLRDH